MFSITIEKEERLPLALIAGGVLLFTGSIGALIGSIVTEKKNEKDDEEVEMQPEAVQPKSESSNKEVTANQQQKNGESAEKIIRNMETAEKIKNMINPDNQKTTQAAPAEEVKEPVTETKTVTEVVGEIVESEKDSVSLPAAETTTPPAETVVAEKVDPKVIETPPLAQPNYENNILNNHFDPQAQAAMKAQAAMMQQQIQQMQQPQVSPIPNPQNIIG